MWQKHPNQQLQSFRLFLQIQHYDILRKYQDENFPAGLQGEKYSNSFF